MVESLGERKKYSSQIWKRQNDETMVPDKGFVKQLKKLCKTFEVVWDRGSHYWEIWDFSEHCEPYMVTRVKTQGRDYRELGTDVLLGLQKNIFWHNNFTTGEICDYLDEMDNQVRRRKEQDFRNRIQSIARDTFLWSQGVLQVQVPKKFSVERMVSNA